MAGGDNRGGPTSHAPGFTPGPWEPRSRDAFAGGETAVEPTVADVNGGRVIALCYGPDRQTNARLIAAAPRMFAALERIAGMTDIEADFDGFEARQIAAEALADLRGGQ